MLSEKVCRGWHDGITEFPWLSVFPCHAIDDTVRAIRTPTYASLSQQKPTVGERCSCKGTGSRPRT